MIAVYRDRSVCATVLRTIRTTRKHAYVSEQDNISETLTGYNKSMKTKRKA